MRPGDLCKVDLPNRDLDLADEHAFGPHPALILVEGPRGIAASGRPEDEIVLIAPITSSDDRVFSPLEGDILLDEEYRRLKLAKPSVIRCRQIMGWPRSDIRDIGENVGEEILLRALTIARELISPGIFAFTFREADTPSK